MFNVRYKFNIGHYVRSLTKFQKAFQEQAQTAVLSTSRQLLTSIIERTPNILNHPRVPEEQIYERTGNMVSGWQPAANFLGISPPELTHGVKLAGGNGAFRWVVSPDQIFFEATNNTRYAEHLEEIGPEIPPSRRVQGPYLMVASSIAQHDRTLVQETEQVLNSVPF